MDQAEDIIQQVRSVENIESGSEWERVRQNTAISVQNAPDWKENVNKTVLVVEAEVQALIYQNLSEGGVIIYADEVSCSNRGSLAGRMGNCDGR